QAARGPHRRRPLPAAVAGGDDVAVHPSLLGRLARALRLEGGRGTHDLELEQAIEPTEEDRGFQADVVRGRLGRERQVDRRPGPSAVARDIEECRRRGEWQRMALRIPGIALGPVRRQPAGLLVGEGEVAAQARASRYGSDRGPVLAAVLGALNRPATGRPAREARHDPPALLLIEEVALRAGSRP